MIQVQNIKKYYDDIKAVDDVSFEIKDGEAFGLLGPNGAGKTTTLNMIVGVLKPDSGKIVINNLEDPTNNHIRQNIGNTPQALAIYEELTAEENIRFFGKLYKLSGENLKKRVEYCLDLVGLTDRRKDFAKNYSGGMKRRLNLACGIVHDPATLLFDEPTVGVDPQSRNLIFDNIEEMKSRGKTVIYTTHYMEEAERLCDRIAIVDHGKILAIDTVDNLIAAHGGQTVITATLGQKPDTVLPDTFKLTDNSLRIETDQPVEIVKQLSELKISYTTLKINRADLEKVFLNLTGRSLRD